MTRKLAVKRLTASDLTFFQWHFVNHPAGNQKAINLNADVFIERLYPSLPDVAVERHWRFALDLNIYGPGMRPVHNIQRKIIKGGSYKNWRLDGEFIFNPDDSPERFNSLAPGDIAVIEFFGSVYPHKANLILLSLSAVEDRPICHAFEEVLGDQAMIELDANALATVLAAGQIQEGHPILELAMEEALEDAALGGAVGTAELRRRRARPTTREDLDRARARASHVGYLGESFVNSYLADLRRRHLIDEFSWAAEENAIAPFDFEALYTDGTPVKIDVKSTIGGFENPIHISYGELIEAASRRMRYDLFRVFEINEDTQLATLRIAEDVGDRAARIIEALAAIPEGVQPDGFSVRPTFLEFGAPIELTNLGEDEAE
jgi:hypothetical protein